MKISSSGRKLRRPQAEALLRSVEHDPGRVDLGLPDGAAGLDVDDDCMVKVDQIVGGIGEKGVALQGSGPLRRRIGTRDELRLRFAGRALGGLVERVEILADRAAGPGEIVPIDRLGRFR